MNNKVISLPIKGIDRSKPIHSTDEGAAQEVINLRPLNGAWRNIGEKEEISKFYSDRIFAAQNSNPCFFPTFYRHPSLPEKCYVSYWEDTKTIELYAFCSPQTFNQNWNNNSGNWVLNDGYWDDNGTWVDTANVWSDSDIIFTIPNGETFKCFAHLNNVLMVVTDVNRYFFLWHQGDLEYKRLEDLPNSFIKLKTNFGIETSFPYISGDATVAYNYLMGEYFKLYAEQKKKGYWEGHNFFMLAFKLYDNTYIPCSELLYKFVGVNGYDNADRLRVIYTPIGTVYNFENIISESPGFNLTLTQTQLDIINVYIDLGIVQSINFLSSSELQQYDFGTAFTDWQSYISGSYFIFLPKPIVEINDIIDRLTVLYDVYQIKKLELTKDYYPFAELSINIDEIETYTHVAIDSFYNTKLIADSFFNYNERLHLASTTNILGNGFNLFERDSNHIAEYYEGYTFTTDDPFTSFSLFVEVEITVNNTPKIIRFDYTDFVDVFKNIDDDYILFLHHFINFPDYRVKYIRILWKDNATNDYYMAKFNAKGVTADATFQLTKANYLNMAYYSAFTAIDTSNFIPFEIIKLLVPASLTGLTAYIPPIIDNIYTDTNRVQVSEQNNIFVYPAKNSYRFAEQDNVVIGLQTVAEELSATRFGQFPLYVFTKQGVWALEQGSGEVLYSNITPLDYSPCVNSDLICSINGAVVFATASGLKLIAGRQVIDISQPVEELIVDNPLLTNPNYLAVVNSESTVNLLQCINKAVTFTDEITSYKSAYDRELKELFITNPIQATGNPAISRPPVRSDYDYSFIFHKESKNWYKFQTQIVNFIQNFYGFSALNFDGTLLSITNLERESNSSQTYSHILYQSRPFSLQTMSFKKIEHIATRIYARVNNMISTFTNAQGQYELINKFTSMYLFGSIDGQEYRLVGGGYSQNTIVTDILWRKTYVSCRYFIVVITVDAKDVMLNRIDFEAVMKFANKIR